jgi:hypothetical protein
MKIRLSEPVSNLPPTLKRAWRCPRRLYAAPGQEIAPKAADPDQAAISGWPDLPRAPESYGRPVSWKHCPRTSSLRPAGCSQYPAILSTSNATARARCTPHRISSGDCAIQLSPTSRPWTSDPRSRRCPAVVRSRLTAGIDPRIAERLTVTNTKHPFKSLA